MHAFALACRLHSSEQVTGNHNTAGKPNSGRVYYDDLVYMCCM